MTLGGRSGRILSTVAFTWLTTSTTLALARLMMFSEMPWAPLTRAWLTRSLKVLRKVATSPKVTTVSPFTFTGSSKTSWASSMRLGTLTEKRPSPVSRLPAAISRLLRINVEIS